MSETKDFKIIKRFGPSILKVKIPDDLLKNLNDYIDKIIEDKKKSADLNHGENLVADVTQEFRLEPEVITENGWTKFLGFNVRKWIFSEMGVKISKFHVRNCWVVRQFENEFNPTHWHNGHISGAGFLKVPKTLGEFKQKKQTKDFRGGTLQLIHGSRQFMSFSTYNIIPKVGDFYFFPHYLMHTVFPFTGTKDERRSISFNANIDENIFNTDIYG